MNLHRDDSWKRRGISLIWDAAELAGVAKANEVRSVREFAAMRGHWPEDLPSHNGGALVVAGVDGIIDALEPADAETWLEQDLKGLIVEFQDAYEMQAALLLWMPDGAKRIKMERTLDTYQWRSTGNAALLALGRCIFGGAESDLGRIIVSNEKSPDVDGPAWKGLHLVRLS
jgi:hypothetical protein